MDLLINLNAPIAGWTPSHAQVPHRTPLCFGRQKSVVLVAWLRSCISPYHQDFADCSQERMEGQVLRASLSNSCPLWDGYLLDCWLIRSRKSAAMKSLKNDIFTGVETGILVKIILVMPRSWRTLVLINPFGPFTTAQVFSPWSSQFRIAHKNYQECTPKIGAFKGDKVISP